MELVADIGPGQILLADRAYDSDALRDSLAARGAWANVKPKTNRTRTLAFSAFLYKERNLVERFFNKLKHFRGVADPLRQACRKTTSPASSSPQPASGCAIMSRWPRWITSYLPSSCAGAPSPARLCSDRDDRRSGQVRSEPSA